MKRIRIFQVLTVTALCSLLLIPAASFAGEKTDFTGEWTLNEDKSDLAEDEKILKIQSDISSSRGERSVSLVYGKK